jgi:hypothetical protein
VNYPVADAGSSRDDPMKFESMVVGHGLLFDPANSQLGGSKP